MATPFYNSLLAAGKIYCHRIFNSGRFTCDQSGRVLTTTGCQLQRNGLYVPLGQIAYEDVVLPEVSEFACLAKIQVNNTTAGATSATVFGDYMNNNAGGWQCGLFVIGATTGYRITARTNLGLVSDQGDVFIPGEKHWRGISYSAAVPISMSKNGVTTKSLPSSGALVWSTIDGIQYGKRIGGTVANGMLVEQSIYITQRLSDADQQTLIAELDEIGRMLNWNCGGPVYNPDGTLYRTFLADNGLICDETAATAGAGKTISNSRLIYGDGTVRAKAIRELAGPAGLLGRSIECTVAGPITLPNVPNASGTWSFWHKTAAGAWTLNPAITSGTTDTTFTLALGDKLFWCGDSTANDYALHHTP
jgi:hypothetical protein